MVRITGVESSYNPKCAEKKPRSFERFENTLNLIFTMSAMEEMMI